MGINKAVSQSHSELGILPSLNQAERFQHILLSFSENLYVFILMLGFGVLWLYKLGRYLQSMAATAMGGLGVD